MLEQCFYDLKVGDVLTDGYGECTILEIYIPVSEEDTTPPYLVVDWNCELGEALIPIFDIYDMEHK